MVLNHRPQGNRKNTEGVVYITGRETDSIGPNMWCSAPGPWRVAACTVAVRFFLGGGVVLSASPWRFAGLAPAGVARCCPVHPVGSLPRRMFLLINHMRASPPRGILTERASVGAVDWSCTVAVRRRGLVCAVWLRGSWNATYQSCVVQGDARVQGENPA